MATEIHGHCDSRFAPLEEAFRANFDEGLELGASLAATLHGEPVVDLWAGCADPKNKVPWQRDTIVLAYSNTKLAATLMTLMLVDRGLLELDTPIARYWPAFAQGGKQHVSVRDALTHQAGVPGFTEPLPFEALRDWPLIIERIAAEPHWFDGERTFCYHAYTFGFILGELIRITTGLRPSEFFRKEVEEPLGADFQIGLRDRADLPRVAKLRFPERELPFEDGSLNARVMASFGPGRPDVWEHMVADIPAANGYGNARGITWVASVFACRGELEGKRFLSSAMVDEARKAQLFQLDSPFGPIRFGLGFGLHCEGYPAPTETSFHWGGYGGSFFVIDVEPGVSCAYVMNNLEVHDDILYDPRQERLWAALGNILRSLPRSTECSS